MYTYRGNVYYLLRVVQGKNLLTNNTIIYIDQRMKLYDNQNLEKLNESRAQKHLWILDNRNIDFA